VGGDCKALGTPFQSRAGTNASVINDANSVVATARMCGHRVHLIEHQWMCSFLVGRGRRCGMRRQPPKAKSMDA
jgi:hypothetical protein